MSEHHRISGPHWTFLALSFACLLTDSQVTAQTVATVTSASSLFRGLLDLSVSVFALQGDIFLNATTWTSAVVPTRNVTLQGPDGVEKATIDFGDLINALGIRPGLELTFRDLRLSGLVPTEDVPSSQLASFPHCIGSVVYPAIISDVNSTLTYDNAEIVLDTKLNAADCQAGLNLIAGAGLDPYRPTLSRGPGWVNVTSDTTFLSKVVRPSTRAQIGTAVLHTKSNTTLICADPSSSNASPPAARRATQLSAGAIAGIVVGSLVGAAVAATGGMFLFLLLRSKRRRQDSPEPVTEKGIQVGSALEPLQPSRSTTASRRVRLRPQTDHASPSATPSAVSEGTESNSLQHWKSMDLLNALAVVDRTQSFATGNWMTDSTAGQLTTPASESTSADTLQGTGSDWRISPQRICICKRPDGSLHRLGAGASGIVMKARLDDVTDVAIKFLNPSQAHLDAVSRQKFAAEVDLLRGLQDTNVVAFLGAWLQQDLVFMVQELMETDLYRALREDEDARQLSWYKRGQQIALEIARGLFYLHSNRIVHLDIKSPNVLLTRSGQAKIADVGIARTLSKTYLSQTVPGGTYNWQAPETLLGQPSSYPADIFSYGVVLLELTTGCQPERGRYQYPQAPRDCPQAIADLADACMDKDAALRPTAKDIIKLISGLQDQPSVLPQPDPDHQPPV